MPAVAMPRGPYRPRHITRKRRDRRESVFFMLTHLPLKLGRFFVLGQRTPFHFAFSKCGNCSRRTARMSEKVIRHSNFPTGQCGLASGDSGAIPLIVRSQTAWSSLCINGPKACLRLCCHVRCWSGHRSGPFLSRREPAGLMPARPFFKKEARRNGLFLLLYRTVKAVRIMPDGAQVTGRHITTGRLLGIAKAPGHIAWCVPLFRTHCRRAINCLAW